MLNRKEFFEYVKDNVLDYLPESFAAADVKLEEIAKNNDTILTGIVIPDGSVMVPTIYLDHLYEQYRNGKDLDTCVGDVADMRIESSEPELDVNINSLMDYESVRYKLQVRICDPELNQERLAGKAVTMQGDFAAYYTVNMSEGKNGIASIPVTENLLDAWGVDVGQLHQDALAADKLRGPVFMSMDDMMTAMLFGGEPAENLLTSNRNAQEFDSTIPMFCLTNESKMNGASLILHEDIRKQIGEIMQGDYFILPSSIHETLILPDHADLNVQELKTMVQDVNASEVSKEERLSDKVQFCDGKTAVMENAEKRALRKEQEKEAASGKKPEKGGIHGKLDRAKAEIKSADSKAKPHHKSKEAAMVM